MCRIFPYILVLLFVAKELLLQAQTHSFLPSCPATRDSLVENAFQRNCISSWQAANGRPSATVSGKALLMDQESIFLAHSFEECRPYHFQTLLKTTQSSPASLTFVFVGNSGETWSRSVVLNSNASHFWTTLFLDGMQLPFQAKGIQLRFSGHTNTLQLDELTISMECSTEKQLRHSSIVGTLHSAKEVKINDLSILKHDSATIRAEEEITVTGEVVLGEGSNVLLGIAPCPSPVRPCKPEPPLPPEAKELVIYNFLTPNGDGNNDVFYIESIQNYPENRLVVVDKRGNTVLEATGYQNNWDGGNCPKGVYTYQLQLRKGEKPITGELLLER